MKIVIGSDHAAFDEKATIKLELENLGWEVLDVGSHTRERTDYPIWAKKVYEEYKSENSDFYIVICGTGVGISNAVNRLEGGKCSAITSVANLKKALTDGANGIGLGSRSLSFDVIKLILEELTKHFK